MGLTVGLVVVVVVAAALIVTLNVTDPPEMSVPAGPWILRVTV